MSRFLLFSWLIALCCFHSIQCSAKDDICPIFIFELRAPKTLNVATNTSVNLASWSGESGEYLWTCKQTNDETYQFYYGSGIVLSKEPEKGRALIIDMRDTNRTNQVFRLPVPRSPKPQDWSQWRRPDFLATGDVGWSIIYNQKINTVSTSLPPGCFELRYRIENWNLGPEWTPQMRQPGS